jgi:hypothetical protein
MYAGGFFGVDQRVFDLFQLRPKQRQQRLVLRQLAAVQRLHVLLVGLLAHENLHV